MSKDVVAFVIGIHEVKKGTSIKVRTERAKREQRVSRVSRVSRKKATKRHGKIIVVQKQIKHF